MSGQKNSPLKRRMAPSVRFTLRTKDDRGNEIAQDFQLCFDANALAALEEKVAGLNTLGLGGLEIFGKMNARVLGAALWAAVLRHHPEYDTVDDKGLPTNDGINAIRSFVDLGNSAEVVQALESAYLATLPKDRADRIRRLAAAADRGDEVPENPSPAAEETPAADETTSIGSPSGPSEDTTASAMTKSAS